MNEVAQVLEHRFHTRHDFTPAAALELCEALRATSDPDALISVQQIRHTLDLMASPLRGRRDLTKIIASLADVGLVESSREGVRLISSAGEELIGRRLWRRRLVGAVHALYALGHSGEVADPRWSYREVCRILVERGTTGVSVDDLVMETVRRAENRFEARRVSFSRSSVAGVRAWLEALDPPVIAHGPGGLISVTETTRASSLIGDVLDVALHLSGGCLVLDETTVANLAGALLVTPQRVRQDIAGFVDPAAGMILLDGHPQSLMRQT